MRALAPRQLVVVTLAVGLLSAACTRSDADTAASVPSTTSSTTTSTTSSTTTTTAPPTTTTTAPAPPPGLGRGSRGPEVQALEQRLADLRYDPGRVDGVFDGGTSHAVMAFQKVQGLKRTGRATDDVLGALASAGVPAPMMADGGPNRVEVDLKRQVLFLYKDGALVRVLPVSTGNNKRYCVEGDCATAVTPGGSFKVSRKIKGLRVSRLGKLYDPVYFNGGIAIHGSPSVPAYPASHGCVRIPMNASSWFHSVVPTGTPVYVLGGKRAPVPFNEQAPPDTTTTAPPPTTTSSTTTTTTIAPTPTTAPTTTSTTTTTTSTTSTTVPR